MRLAGLSIDGFGIFHDVSVESLPADLSVFLGDNEAGKSTTLAFVHTVLFGYPDGRTKERAYPALSGGQPGGRLFLDTDSDGLITVERTAGPKGGPVTVRYADSGREEGEVALRSLLGGATRRLYRNLYAFSLSELQELETLTDDEMRDVIYGASLGAGVRSLPEARKRLDTRLGALFKPGGTNPAINQLLKKLEDVRAKLRDAAQGIHSYEDLAAALARIETDIGNVREALRGTRSRYERVTRHLQLWDDWIGLRSAKAAIEELPEQVKDFPEDGRARMGTLRQECEAEGKELRIAMEDLKEKRDRCQREAFDETLLGQEEGIRWLARGLETYENAAREIPRAEDRCRSIELQTAEILAELGTEWTLERALGLDRSAHAREEIVAFRAALADAEHRHVRAKDTVESSREALKSAREQESRANNQVTELQGQGPGVDRETRAAGEEIGDRQPKALEKTEQEDLDGAVLWARKGTIRELRDALRKRDAAEVALRTWGQLLQASQRLADSTGDNGFGRRLQWAAAAALGTGVVVGLGLWAAGLPSEGITAAAVFVAMAIVLLGLGWSAQRTPTGQTAGPIPDSRAGELNNDLKRESDSVRTLQEQLGLSGGPEMVNIDWLEDRNALQLRCAEANKLLDEASTEAAIRGEAQAQAIATWNAWLAAHNLDQGWSPDSAERALEHAGRLAERAAQRDEAVAQAKRLTSEADDYRARVAKLARSLEHDAVSQDRLGTLVSRLESNLQDHKQRQALCAGLEAEIQELETRCGNRRAGIDELERQIGALVEQAAASGWESFQRRGRYYEERRALIKSIAGFEGRLERISGQTDLGALKQELSKETVDALRAVEADLGERVARDEVQLEELHNEQGRQEERRRELADEDAIAVLRTEEERLLESLRQQVDDWGRHAMARHLLIAAKERFEQAHQPEVIKAASRYFSRMTGGRYERIVAPHGEGSIEVVDLEGRRKGMDELSRGTSEQLYLAIRFGYIASHTAGREALPILMDDVLVNFDPARASLAAKGILDVAETRQVLFFTCHPATVKVFKALAPDVTTYRIADGTICKETG